MTSKVPSNLPPESMRWGRSVEQRLDQIETLNEEVRKARIVRNASMSANAPGSEALVPAQPNNLTAESELYPTETGTPRARVFWEWNEVSVSTSGVNMQVFGYEVWGRQQDLEPDAQWRRLTFVNSTSADLETFYPGTGWDFRVRAMGGTPGVFSDEVELEIPPAEMPPPVPNPPVVSEYLGAITISWDGEDTDGEPVGSDFDRAEVEYRIEPPDPEDEALPWTVAVSFKSAGSHVLSQLEYGKAYQFRSRSFNTSGFPSEYSEISSQTPRHVVRDDLLDSIIDEMKLAPGSVGGIALQDGAVTTPKIAANAVIASKIAVTDWTNLWKDDRLLEDYAPWTVINPGTDSAYLEKAGTGTQHGTYWTHTEFAVTPGEEYRVRVTRTDVMVGSVTLYWEKRVSGVWSFGGAAVPMTSSGKFAANIVVPEGVDRLRFGLYTESSVASGAVVKVGSFQIFRRNAGELIVDGGIVADNIASDAILARHIAVGEVTADKIGTGVLSAQVTLSGLIRTAESGGRVEISNEGLVVYGPTGDIQTTVTANESKFYGEVDASVVEVDTLKIRQGSTLDAGKSFTLNSGVSAPVAAPSVVNYYDSIQLKDSGGNVITPKYVGRMNDGKWVAYVSGNVATIHNATTGAYLSSVSIPIPNESGMNGMTVVNDWIVYCKYTLRSMPWRYVYELNAVRIATGYTANIHTETLPDEMLTVYGALGPGSSTGDLVDIKYTGGYATVREAVYNFPSADSIPTLTSAFTNIASIPYSMSGSGFDGSGSDKIKAVAVGNFDLGSKHVGLFSTADPSTIRFYDSGSSITEDVDNRTATPISSQASGMGYYGGKIWIFQGNAAYMLDGITWSGAATRSLFSSYTYHLTTGPYETISSAINTLTQKKRARIRATTAALPAGTDRVKLYAGTVSGTRYLQATSAATTITLTTQATSGSTPPVSSSFPNATPAEIRSTNGEIILRGNGTGEIPATILTGTIDVARLPASTETAIGAAERATLAEARTGTDTTRYVSPAGLAYALEASTSYGSLSGSGGDVNGGYIKYPNGALECWVRCRITIASVNTYTSRVWTFPVAFVGGLPIVNITPEAASTAVSSANSDSVSLTSAAIGCARTTTTATYIHASARGFWK